MASMLNCSICPQRPTFTDTSHLLTHVSSKGHLAQLHKLQIKSHQEIAAGFELDAYNQWFHQHGLAQLLSERMQQKERKQASKRAGTRKKRSLKREESAEDASVSPARQSRRGRGRGRSKKVKQDAAADDAESRGYLQPSTYPLTPLRQTSWTQSSPPLPIPPQIDPALVTTPTNANTKLKGKIWPGMDLFDAATPDEARRRNQKKDASVVKRMERLSRMVIPNEVTFSTEWSFKKSRHIDDLDDATSLIEGESPLMLKPKPKPRGRKKALGRVSPSIPRASKRKARLSVSPKRSRRAPKSAPKPAIARIPSSAHLDPFSDPFIPGDDEGDFEFAVGNFPPKKARAEFAIYEDSPSIRPKATQSVSMVQSYSLPVPRLTFHSAPWLQPQNQNQNPLFLDSHYNPHRSGMPHSTLQDIGAGKENMPPGVPHELRAANPLMWPSPQDARMSVGQSPSSALDPFPGFLASGGLPDPFSYTRNPLLDAFARFSGDQRSEDIKHSFSSTGNSSGSQQSHPAMAGIGRA